VVTSTAPQDGSAERGGTGGAGRSESSAGRGWLGDSGWPGGFGWLGGSGWLGWRRGRGACTGLVPSGGTGRLAYLDGTDGRDGSGLRLGSSDGSGGGPSRGSGGLGRSGGSADPGWPGRG